MLEKLDYAVEAAKHLLGSQLIHDTPEGRVSGIIVETEAYHQDDVASHTYRGKTPRNAVMFGPAGYAYVYFTYGMHYCFNVVTGPEGSGQAVLIRALEPVEGVEIMKQRRGRENIHELTNGPAKLVQALGITKAHYGVNLLNGGDLRIEPGVRPKKIIQTTRIGISEGKDVPWRFYVAGNDFVSRKS
jgi:DNA-3-methyladenine glycosylase